MNHVGLQPSGWVMRWLGIVDAGGKVVDLACGSGRHSRLLLEKGYTVFAIDRDLSGMGDLRGRAGVELLEADLENGSWPISVAAFDGMIVTNYLHRPYFPHLMAALKPGGVLIYETFAQGNGEFGRPSNPEFLLQRGELLSLVNGSARVIAYEDVYVELPKPALVQRICAVKNDGAARHFPALSN
jgi:SAM-dependent methyltransferase